MDRSLGTLLRALQTASNIQDVSRLLSSATTLLTLLSNPLNITLLTSQLLAAPSIWQRPDGLRTTHRILTIFSSAAIHLVQQEQKALNTTSVSPRSILDREEWATAVVRGADDRSPRWRHLCVLVGLLIGFEGRDQQTISTSLRTKLENAAVKAVNLFLHEGETFNELAGNSVAMMLGQIFDVLSQTSKMNLDHNLLLPILYRAPFLTKDGLHSGYFLSNIDADILQTKEMKFDWSNRSTTYVQCHRMASESLLASLGSLSRLIAFSAEQVQSVDMLLTMVTDLAAFTRSLCVQWRQNKLSEIDATEETTFLTAETLSNTLPLLWNTLKSTMFAIVIVLRSLLSRTLGDARIRADDSLFMAIQTLHILRNLYFMSSRLGANAFSQYTFVYLTAIDILTQYPVQAEAFLRDIHRSSPKSISQHPLDRSHDLYFLNTAEHFAFVLPTDLNELLLIGAANPYLGLGSDPRLMDMFEAAHSVMLSVLAVPHNSDLLARHLHSYLDILFQVFPQNLSPRQFRMAVKTLIRITSPPAPISKDQPLLPSTILELVRHRLHAASSDPLHQTPNKYDPGEEKMEDSTLSEKSVLALTLIDALPYLPIDQLEDWLPIVAKSLTDFQDVHQSHTCIERFWQALSTGEMDVERASLCISWWGTEGGRGMLLIGRDRQQDGPLMSGGLQESSRL